MRLPLPPRRPRGLLAAVLAAAFVVSCDESPTQPRLQAPPPDDSPAFNTGSGDQFEVIGPIAVSGNGTAQVFSTSGLPTFANETLVEVAMSGYITQQHNGGTTTSIGPLGHFASGYQCWKKSSVSYSLKGSTANGAGACTPATPVDTVVTTFRGTGTAHIGPGYDNNWCYKPSCYT